MIRKEDIKKKTELKALQPHIVRLKGERDLLEKE